jgi:hypothetical protein
MKKSKLFYSIITVVIIAYLVPWILYGIGLANIIDRPSSEIQFVRLSASDKLSLWNELKLSEPIEIKQMSPWSYLVDIVGISGNEDRSSIKISWFIARDYNRNHLRNVKMGFWHLSGAALSIWLTRNWDADQIIFKAYDIKKQKMEDKPV